MPTFPQNEAGCRIEIGGQHALFLQHLRGRVPLLVGDCTDAMLFRVRAEERRLDIGLKLRARLEEVRDGVHDYRAGLELPNELM